MTAAPINIRNFQATRSASPSRNHPCPQFQRIGPNAALLPVRRRYHHRTAVGGRISSAPAGRVLEEKIFTVCFYLADSDEELKLKIAAQVSEQKPVAA